MNIDLTELSQNQVYHTMTQTVVPRPIAWVLSEHENGKLNLAPFSYFQRCVQCTAGGYVVDGTQAGWQ